MRSSRGCAWAAVLAAALAGPAGAAAESRALALPAGSAFALPGAPHAFGAEAGQDAETAPEAAPLALANPYVTAPSIAASISGGKRETPPKKGKRARPSRHRSTLALTPERAQALLRSLTIPGWGQATLGHRTAGTVFGVLESGVWGSFMAFRIQERMRLDASARTARIFAATDLKGRDEEFLRLVGAFASSEEYNLLVVVRDAANQFYDDPTAYRDYIARHSLKGANTWRWQDEASFLRYRAQRKEAQRASLRANTALALAVGNRLLSVLHTARVAGRRSPAAAGDAPTWNIEVSPAGGDDPTAYRFGLRASF